MAEQESTEDGASDKESSLLEARHQMDMAYLSQQRMTDEHKNILTDNTVRIVEELEDVETVLEYLKERECLNERNRQAIMANRTPMERHQHLLRVLKRSSEATFYVFTQALLETQDNPDIYNRLRDNTMPSVSESKTSLPQAGPAREYYLKLREFHKKKLERLAKDKPLRHTLTSYVQMAVYPKEKGLSTQRKGFKESVLETIKVLGNPIEPKNLFKNGDENTQPSKVLMLGAPGVGKSMTSYHFLSENTLGNLWQEEFHFIVFIILKELNHINWDISFEDILFNIYGPPVDQAKKVLKYLQHNEEKMLFIFDGFDEAEGLGVNINDEHKITFQRLSEKTKPQRLIYNLLRGNIFSRSNILVTGRPHVLEELQNLTDRHVELLGLDREKLEEMTSKELVDNPGLCEEVHKYFDSHPNVVNLCSVPVNAKGFLEHVKLNSGAKYLHEKLPETKAGLFFLITLNLLQCHDKLFASKHDLMASEILEERKHLICALAKLAKEGLFNQEGVNQLFDTKVIAKHGLSKDEVIGSGIMAGHLSAVSDIFRKIEKILLQFSHLTMQEFFAALELSQLPIKTLEHISLAQEGERDIVLQLSLGVMGDQLCQGLLSILYPNTPSGDYNKKAAKLLQAVWASARHHQGNGNLFSIHCLSESKQFHLADSLKSKAINVVDTLNLVHTIISPTDCSPIAEFLANISEPCTEVVLNGRVDVAGLKQIIQSRGFSRLTLLIDFTSAILAAISETIKTNDTITGLTLFQADSSSPLTKADWDGFQPPQNTSLQYVGLLKLVDEHTFQTVCDKLSLLHGLHALQVWLSTLTDITPLAVVPNTIKYLTLDECGLKGKDMNVIADIMQQNGLAWLDIRKNDVGDQGVAILAKCMQGSCNMLQGLVLNRCKISSSGIQGLCDSLKENVHLKMLDLSNNDLGEEVHAVTDPLRYSNIEELRLCDCDVSAGRGTQLLASLKHNSKLVCLYLSGYAIDDPSKFALLVSDMLKTNQNLRALGLGGFGMTDETLNIITEGLRYNEHLQLLDLNQNPSLTCSSIIRLLSRTQIQYLSVAGCKLEREGWREVGKALCDNKHVKMCYVGDGTGEAMVGLIEEVFQNPNGDQVQHLILFAQKHKLSSLICQIAKEGKSNIKVSCSEHSEIMWMLSGLFSLCLPPDIRAWYNLSYLYID